MANIENPEIRNLVTEMINEDRDKRPLIDVAEWHVSFWQPLLTHRTCTFFPPYFGFLHKVIGSFMGRDPDEIIRVIHGDLDLLKEQFAAKQEPVAAVTTASTTEDATIEGMYI